MNPLSCEFNIMECLTWKKFLSDNNKMGLMLTLIFFKLRFSTNRIVRCNGKPSVST